MAGLGTEPGSEGLLTGRKVSPVMTRGALSLIGTREETEPASHWETG